MSTDTPDPTTATEEIKAMSRIVSTLDKLDLDARSRVVDWLHDRYNSPVYAEVVER